MEEETTGTVEQDSQEELTIDETQESEEPVEDSDSGQSEDVSDEMGTSSDEETFFDPKDLPDELQSAYKNMQAAFTKKTQALADERKTSEQEMAELRQKAEQYSKYERYAPILDEMLSGQKKQPQQNQQIAVLENQLREQGYSDEAIALAKIGAEFTLGVTSQQLQQTKAAEQFDRAIAQAESLDARLNDASLVYDIGGETVTFGDLVSSFVAATPGWQNDPVKATKKAIEKMDGLIESAKSEGKKELSLKAKSKSDKFPNIKSSPQSAQPKAAPKDLFEAAKLAEEELGY